MKFIQFSGVQFEDHFGEVCPEDLLIGWGHEIQSTFMVQFEDHFSEVCREDGAMKFIQVSKVQFVDVTRRFLGCLGAMKFIQLSGVQFEDHFSEVSPKDLLSSWEP